MFDFDPFYFPVIGTYEQHDIKYFIAEKAANKSFKFAHPQTIKNLKDIYPIRIKS